MIWNSSGSFVGSGEADGVSLTNGSDEGDTAGVSLTNGSDEGDTAGVSLTNGSDEGDTDGAGLAVTSGFALTIKSTVMVLPDAIEIFFPLKRSIVSLIRSR